MNVGAAALQMPGDLGFNDRVVGLGAGMFFLGYLVLEIPGALIAERWSARRWIARIMISWGIITVVMALSTRPGIYLIRFLVGAAEAGFFPAVIVYISHCSGPRIAPRPWRVFTLPILFPMSLARPSPAGCSDLLARSERLAMAIHTGRNSRDRVRSNHGLLSHGLAAPG